METNAFNSALTLPDPWQQQALRALREGHDVVVNAPTGAGKTFIFELFVQSGFRGQAIFTVPTRALANDKRYEWSERGWNVGIMTGDLVENQRAPVIAATLETQRSRLIQGFGPELLVVDEYQMVADPGRGLNYELAIALAPAETQLLLLSGSVGNPSKVVDWLQRMGRSAVLVEHRERPVPQDEIFFEALPDRLPKKIYGFWVRRLARALAADLGPILVFAPRRKASEDLARQLSGALPCPDPLELSREQKALAGPALTRLLRNRLAFHHSGLSYQQRAGLIEPLAKAGQLRAVVATTGLAAGINFSMRSTVVTDREYRVGDQTLLIRPDELLQMFGRAGRRGLDERGTILVEEGKPRLRDAAPIQLTRTNQVDWPVFISVMRQAVLDGADPVRATEILVSRLFSDQAVPIGLRDFLEDYREAPRIYQPSKATGQPSPRRRVIEMQNSDGIWERRPGPRKTRLGQTLIFHQNRWRPALTVARTLANIKVGSLCRIHQDGRRTYGREVTLARFPTEERSDYVHLLKWVRKGLRSYFKEIGSPRKYLGEKWRLEELEKEILPLLPVLTSGGQLVELLERKGMIHARVHYDQSEVFAWVDKAGRPLLNPPLRRTEHAPLEEFAPRRQRDRTPAPRPRKLSPAEIWYRLRLIDNRGVPTRRGVIFSFFNYGEGLAVAAALEDPNYSVDDLVWDIANLRAGHRFDTAGEASGRFRMACRNAFPNTSYEGYLKNSLPPEYGEGASEVMQEIARDPAARYRRFNEDLRPGDIERVTLEWRSLLRHVAAAPEHDWDRWTSFQNKVRDFLEAHPDPTTPLELPPLTPQQRHYRPLPLRF